jgi:putative Holliday junction resolvase
MQNNDADFQGVVLGLDVGDARIGVARAHSISRLPEPLATIHRKTENPIEALRALVKAEGAEKLVVGLPLLPSGDEGSQAEAVRSFVSQAETALGVPAVFVDESFTSAEADSYLAQKQWKSQESNDALAACLILERYFTEAAHV